MRGVIVQFRQAITVLPVQRQARGTCKKEKKKLFTSPLAEKLNPIRVWREHHGCIRRHIVLCCTASAWHCLRWHERRQCKGIHSQGRKHMRSCYHKAHSQISAFVRWVPWTTHSFPPFHLHGRCEDVSLYIRMMRSWVDASKAPKRGDKGSEIKARVSFVYKHDVLTHLNCVVGLSETLCCI